MTRAGERWGAADWLVGLGAGVLLVSLFLTWSHQVPGRAVPAALQGVPAAATAWQVYTMMDVALALLAVALVAVAVFGSHRGRLLAAIATMVAMAFVVHALAVPPTNGLPLAMAHSATAGAGEVLAIAGLAVALVGLSCGRNRRYSALWIHR